MPNRAQRLGWLILLGALVAWTLVKLAGAP